MVEINGVEFEYSKLAIGSEYHEVESQGDFISYNGQHLRRGYVCTGPAVKMLLCI